jgi:hypothetical protein
MSDNRYFFRVEGNFNKKFYRREDEFDEHSDACVCCGQELPSKSFNYEAGKEFAEFLRCNVGFSFYNGLREGMKYYNA